MHPGRLKLRDRTTPGPQKAGGEVMFFHRVLIRPFPESWLLWLVRRVTPLVISLPPDGYLVARTRLGRSVESSD